MPSLCTSPTPAGATAREIATGLTVEHSASASVDARNPGINVEKSTTTPVVAEKGATVTFQIIVQNTGEATLTDVVLSDGRVGGAPTAVFGGIGSLPPTVKWQYECVVANVQNDFDNTVTVQAKDLAEESG